VNKTNHRTVTGIAVILAWFLALVVGLIERDYVGLELVTPVMLIYAGYLFGDDYFRRVKRNGNGAD
jgi:hypothetical protein